MFASNPIVNGPTTFLKIGKFSKIYSNNISTGITNNKFLVEKINNIYTLENYVNQDTYQYGSTRQHNFSSLNSFLPDFTSLVNNSSFKTFIDYSINSQANKTINSVHANLFTKSLNAFNKELALLARINWDLLNCTSGKLDSSDSNSFKKFCSEIKHLGGAPLISASIKRAMALAEEHSIECAIARGILRALPHAVARNAPHAIALAEARNVLGGVPRNVVLREEREILHNITLGIPSIVSRSVTRAIKLAEARGTLHDIARDTAIT